MLNREENTTRRLVEIFLFTIGVWNLPKGISPKYFHELVCFDIGEHFRRAGDASIRKHNIESSISVNRIIHHIFHRGLITGIKLADLYFNPGVKPLDFSFMRGEMRGIVIAEVNGLSTVACVLMRAGSSNS
jgi:hypothetical protein